MIHFSCDRCKRMLDPNQDTHYIVKVEAYADVDALDGEEIEDDRDHLMELQEIIERTESADDYAGEDLYQKKRYDLCCDCYKQFIKNPIGREPALPLGFSHN